MLSFSPEHKNSPSLKRKRYALSDCLNSSDLETLEHRYENSDALSYYVPVSQFEEKLDASEFARALKDVHSTFQKHHSFDLVMSSFNGR